MKAAVMYERRKPMVIKDLELVAPGPGEVEIKLMASGVCHSDFNHWQRDTATPLPVVLGHEGAGIVSAVGPNVTRVKPGDHVIIAFGPKCGECYYCVRGMPYLCTGGEIGSMRSRVSRSEGRCRSLRWIDCDVDTKLGEYPEVTHHQRFDLCPVEATETTTEGGHGNRQDPRRPEPLVAHGESHDERG